jgi:hypothetical protein
MRQGVVLAAVVFAYAVPPCALVPVRLPPIIIFFTAFEHCTPGVTGPGSFGLETGDEDTFVASYSLHHLFPFLFLFFFFFLFLHVPYSGLGLQIKFGWRNTESAA